MNENKPFDGITGLYFLSGAIHDRLLSVWYVNFSQFLTLITTVTEDRLNNYVLNSDEAEGALWKNAVMIS